VPLGDLRIVGPAIVAVLAVILFTRTRGVYTKWLAVIIFVTCFAIIYLIDPVVFQELIRYGVQAGLSRY
jgi:ABC-type transport system involved in cytochrome bd biosynthesis fused ATPase/permease subunit